MSGNLRFRVAIPARYGSSRLPGKPLLPVGGLPMIQRAYQAAQNSGALQVIVATDDARIVNAVEAFGGEACLTRSDHASGTDRLAEVASTLDWPDDEIVVNLQGDEPLLPRELLAQVARGLHEHPEAGIATLCTLIHETDELFDPNVVKVLTDRQGFALYFSRAPIPYHRAAFQTGPPKSLPDGVKYWRHLGIYAYRAGTLRAYPDLPRSELEHIEALEQLRGLWNGVRIYVEEASTVPPLGVDTEDDLIKVNAWYAQKLFKTD